MKKFIAPLLLLLGLIFLSACGGNKEPAPVENNLPQSAGSDAPTDTPAQCTAQSLAVVEIAQPGDHITGELEDYSVTIVNYNDFTCEGCATVASAIAKARELYPEDIRLIFRHYTSPAKNSLVAARAAEAAGKQGQFSGMYEVFFNDYEPWIDLNEEDFNNFIWEQVTLLDMDEDQFFSDMNSQEIAEVSQAQYAQALSVLNVLSLDIHSIRITAAAEAAGQQNQFWELYKWLLSTQTTWEGMDAESFDAYLFEQVQELGLNPTQFEQDFEALISSENDTTTLNRAYNFFRLFYRTSLGMAAAKTAEAAASQGKFWEIHDLLFANQALWTEMNEQEFLLFISSQLEELEIDTEQFLEDYSSPSTDEKIITDYMDGRVFNTNAPIVLVNGSLTPPYLTTVGDFLVWLDNLMVPYGRHIRDNQFYDCPQMTIDTDSQYTATLHTEKGEIVLALYPDAAPFAVNSFVFLAEQDYYDNTPFYAVIEGFVAQAGDPSGTGWGNPGYLFDIETSELTFDRPYMVAMANSGPGTNNSQFFISFSPLSYLNGKNTIFGEVIDGVDVLKALSIRDPERDPYAPLEDYILDITIEKQ